MSTTTTAAQKMGFFPKTFISPYEADINYICNFFFLIKQKLLPCCPPCCICWTSAVLWYLFLSLTNCSFSRTFFKNLHFLLQKKINIFRILKGQLLMEFLTGYGRLLIFIPGIIYGNLFSLLYSLVNRSGLFFSIFRS